MCHGFSHFSVFLHDFQWAKISHQQHRVKNRTRYPSLSEYVFAVLQIGCFFRQFSRPGHALYTLMRQFNTVLSLTAMLVFDIEMVYQYVSLQNISSSSMFICVKLILTKSYCTTQYD